ncbi:unnamed protein product [Didymodactylos carnosus]|uniref:Uncharacterized protein n=1 Tax=Didymodactylos carnosus TaxID=1234261 RepID=A0A815NJ04_9BILA|nr:unnamed protein product [Didymodactylos carnosus]CAF4309174.1 unnamed protein product [Didymodactylos carnosus]
MKSCVRSYKTLREHLWYTVVTIPETMIEYIYDYGYLDNITDDLSELKRKSTSNFDNLFNMKNTVGNRRPSGESALLSIANVMRPSPSTYPCTSMDNIDDKRKDKPHYGKTLRLSFQHLELRSLPNATATRSMTNELLQEIKPVSNLMSPILKPIRLPYI